DARLARHVVERRAGGAAQRDACAHGVDDALRAFPRELAGLGRGLHGPDASWPASQRPADSLRPNDEGAPWGALAYSEMRSASGRRRCLGFGRGRGGSGRGGVVELLLGPEQCVQHLRAQALAEGEREPGADRQQQELAAETALALALR